ncbi:glycoside hydrolase family 20 [Mariniphaga sediminis]|uniref:beta-N-acetylhexosaminidase n=1 Tax=Mariniphaga sediminis TaxID=1628158 RepID=A0A399D5E1_9BACT|nr:beta-N-acetylhexosaminidase [Mariniphaga sediminis]RIH67104.1 glycoside hydrolase family 20 [Mariniphaga sediminis]
MKKILQLIFLIVTCYKLTSAIEIIPCPVHILEKPGTFVLSSRTIINYSEKASNEAELFQEVLKKEFDVVLTPYSKVSQNNIVMEINPLLKDRVGLEGYELKVTENFIKITGATNTGIFYGIQTLRQLLRKISDDNLIYSRYSIPCVEIIDYPRFKWRGFMLDVSRYFHGVDVVKGILDEMALLKMNVFHWHLTDDQGWRIPIDKYPRLISVGSKRDSSMISKQKDSNNKWVFTFDGVPHEGYYTKEEIKEIIEYASIRHITVVPEIDMPSHNQAAMAAYPWLGTRNSEVKVPTTFGGEPYLRNPSEINLANPKVVKFFKNVLDEVIELFPSGIIHTGGDEVWVNLWKESSEINEFMKKNGFRTYADLQMWFTSEISDYLKSKGKRMMGWNDITGDHTNRDLNADDFQITIDKQPASGTIIGFWRGDLDLIFKAASKGYDIVNSNSSFTYLNYNPADLTLEKAYSFEPIPEGLDIKYHDRILGLTCPLWTEWVPNEAVLDYQIFPRLAAYSEVGWTQKEHKNFNDFNNALNLLVVHWNRMGVNY